MKLTVSKHTGFCFGVKRAVDAAFAATDADTYTYGELIHNPIVTGKLKAKGIRAVTSPDEIESGTVIIRSHGVSPEIIAVFEKKGIKVVDATCPFVKKIHELVKKYDDEGYHILIAGDKDHPEVVGINGWCGGRADVIDENTPVERFAAYDKIAIVAQTTFSPQKYRLIAKKYGEQQSKTVELFNTICYTTVSRQKEAERLARVCDAILVIGSRTSANTTRLVSIASSGGKRAYLIESEADLPKLKLFPDDAVGIIAGASAPDELTMEVIKYMSQNDTEIKNETLSEEFTKGVEESLVSYKPGRRVKGTVLSADEKGIKLNIGGKQDGFIPNTEVSAEDEYNPADYPEGTEIEVKITGKKSEDTGCIPLSKKEVDLIREGDKIVETIRNGEIFEVKVEKMVNGGLLSRLGNYTVFIPASHVQERFVRDLKPYVGQTLAVTALEIDDDKHKIVVSHKKVAEADRKEREEIFWTHIVPNVVVSGVVKRTTNFGAFVSVDGVDCLAHIVDLSWSHIKSVDEVLKVGETYEFLVLSADREKNRVSLGYKQLQAHPFNACMEKHPVGSTLQGKVVSIVPFGVFVEVEPHIEGLVHVSEVAHDYIKNISDVIKVGDEVTVKIINYDENNRKINLSIKACIEAPATTDGEKPDRESGKKSGSKRKDDSRGQDSGANWSEESANNPFADLLKDLDVTASDTKKTKKAEAKPAEEAPAEAEVSSENTETPEETA